MILGRASHCHERTGKGSDRLPNVPRNDYTVHRARIAPTLDADWDAAEWSTAQIAPINHFFARSSHHRPKTEAKVLYDSDFLYVHFRVRDQFVRCIATEDHGKVFQDSCAEFFVQPSEDPVRGYFNFEMNCGGTMLLYHITDASKTPEGRLAAFTRVSSDWMSRIERFHTMPKVVEPEITEPVEWRVAYRVPMALFDHYCGPVQRSPGTGWRGNFFKCADATSHPHWGMWSLVESRSFHEPEWFGTLTLGQ